MVLRQYTEFEKYMRLCLDNSHNIKKLCSANLNDQNKEILKNIEEQNRAIEAQLYALSTLFEGLIKETHKKLTQINNDLGNLKEELEIK